jgi:hypothetical protein
VGPGIACGNDCTEVYPFGTNVTLNPSPLPSAPPVQFDGWSDACMGTGPCNLVMTTARNVIATFTRLFNLSVDVIGNGNVSSVPAGIDCGAGSEDCFEQYPDGETVTLRAVPSPDNFFIQWLGACSGTVDTCTLVMSADRSVTAEFNSIPLTPDPTAGRPTGTLGWSSQLEAEGAWGRVRSGGTEVAVSAGAVTPFTVVVRPGMNLVEAQLSGATGRPGVWRFDLLDRGALEPGSLRVLEGQVMMVTEDAVVFRLSGRAGERVAFTFRSQG